MDKELHLFILWQNARFQQKKIVDDISMHFKIYQIFELSWSADCVASNYTRFYGTHLPTGCFKEKECGTGDFLLVVLEDDNPKYDFRATSRGQEWVNINMFDAKQLYRSWTGGGSQVHGTNSTKETNHDLTLLLGCNIEDFYNTYTANNEIIHLERDIIGASHWNSIEELFYVLNNTIDTYVVMRGQEYILNKLEFPNEHRDIDLLVSKYNDIVFIINGTACINSKRPHYLLEINGYEYYLDIWDIKNNYFDIIWSERMIQSRVLNSFIYELNPEDNFYCLLYHTYIQKPQIADDYILKLQFLAQQLGLDYVNNSSKVLELLDVFFCSNNYDYVHSTDNTVYFNSSLVEQSKIYKQFGTTISKSSSSLDDKQQFFTAVYKRYKTYIKRASDFLIDNEIKFLKRLKDYDCFPKIISSGDAQFGKFVEITELKGDTVQNFFKQKKHRTQKYLRSFMQELHKILSILVENNILHRDLIDRNWVIREENGKCKLMLIDFGWAADIDKRDNTYAPDGLCTTFTRIYKPKIGFSDFYSVGVFLEMLFPIQIPLIKKVEKYIKSISSDHYASKEQLQNDLAELEKLINKSFTLHDLYKVFLYRHGRVNKYVSKIRRKLKRP